MAHVFDSGMTVPQRRKLREAIVAQLKREMLVPTLPGSTGSMYLQAVVELAAPINLGDGDLEAHLKEAIAGRSPVVAVALGGRSFEATNTDERHWRGDIEVHVYVLSGHGRGLLDRLRGGDAAALASDTADPGLETAMEHVFERLTGFKPADCRASELRPVSEEFPYLAEDFTLAEMVFGCRLQTDVNPNRGLTQVATQIHTTHAETAAGDPADLVALTELEP